MLFYACMSFTVSYEGFSSISTFSNVLVDFPFFQIISDYLISYFPRSTLWTTTNLKGSTFTRPSTFFHSLYITKPLHSSVLKRFPHVLQFYCRPKFLCRDHILRSDTESPSNHPCVILLQSDHILLFNWPSITSV